jgi:hypothetical protein
MVEDGRPRPSVTGAARRARTPVLQGLGSIKQIKFKSGGQECPPRTDFYVLDYYSHLRL